jgi:hypothetical protein
MIVLTVITAAIHLFLGIRFISDGIFGILFVLNGIGFLVLLFLVLRPVSIFVGRDALLHYALVGFAAVTILAWLFVNGDFTNVVGVATKVVELLLIVVTWLHLRVFKGEAGVE